jgi:pyridoxine 5-phosphate synthase
MSGRLRLGVNIDHVATIRNARGGAHPDPARAAEIAAAAGADGITIHLREDRRHIRDGDLDAIRAASSLPINLEMAATEEMTAIACGFRPHAACIVPEKREERTTEGGLDVAGLHTTRFLPSFASCAMPGPACRCSLNRILSRLPLPKCSVRPVVELHTGRYAELWIEGGAEAAAPELARLQAAADEARKRGIEPHAGHGLTFENVGPVAAIPEIAELNIGHFLIGEAIFIGLEEAILEMRRLMDEARSQVSA